MHLFKNTNIILHTLRSILRSQFNPECSSDFLTERYESCRFVYFPTKTITTGCKKRS